MANLLAALQFRTGLLQITCHIGLIVDEDTGAVRERVQCLHSSSITNKSELRAREMPMDKVVRETSYLATLSHLQLLL